MLVARYSLPTTVPNTPTFRSALIHPFSLRSSCSIIRAYTPALFTAHIRAPFRTLITWELMIFVHISSIPSVDEQQRAASTLSELAFPPVQIDMKLTDLQRNHYVVHDKGSR